jgi:hypothetical protein
MKLRIESYNRRTLGVIIMNGDVTPAYLGICIISIPEQIISTA